MNVVATDNTGLFPLARASLGFSVALNVSQDFISKKQLQCKLTTMDSQHMNIIYIDLIILRSEVTIL